MTSCMISTGSFSLNHGVLQGISSKGFFRNRVGFDLILPKGLMETNGTSGAPTERNACEVKVYSYTLWRILLYNLLSYIRGRPDIRKLEPPPPFEFRVYFSVFTEERCFCRYRNINVRVLIVHLVTIKKSLKQLSFNDERVVLKSW